MDKGMSLTGQPVFTQVLNLIPKGLLNRLSKRHNCNRYVKSFDTYHHTVSMLFAVFQRCNSLREVSTGMQAWLGRLSHLGVRTYPKRSTLADANKRCTSDFFKDLYHGLAERYQNQGLPDSRKIDHRLFLMDSTTVDLFNNVMQGAGISKANGRRKGGVKVHMLVNPSHAIPSVVYLSEARHNDRVFMDKVQLPPGSILVFDKGYFKFSQWSKWTDEGVYWVTRLSKIAYYQVLEDLSVNEKQREAGVISDQKILLGRGTSASTEVILARRIVFYDAEKNREFEFVTNHERFSPSNIAALYKKRWNIEIIFKSLKHNYQLRYFLGDTPNAICIQIWCSLIADLLLKVIHKNIQKRKWSFANLRSIIRMHLSTYVDLFAFLTNPTQSLNRYQHPEILQYQLAFNST